MNETKEMLEATVKGLQDKVNQLNIDLKTKEKQLEDYNKPLMLNDTYAALEDIIGNAVGDYEFECGHFEYEFNISYDNKIELSDLNFTDHYELANAVMRAIDKHFKLEQDETNE
tara:strand:- start:134 stop:475 length:342 start_codon:yes stop_codon:yes gene_type:complete